MAIFRQEGLTTTAIQVKGTGGTSSGGQLLSYSLGNSSASDAWVKFYDIAATPTVGTTTPVYVVYIPKGTNQQLATIQDAIFSNGIWVAATGGEQDSDATATTAHTVMANATFR